MTRGAGGYHFALREKLKGFESIKDMKDQGLVYDYVTTLGVQKTAFAVDSIEDEPKIEELIESSSDAAPTIDALE